MSKIRILVHGGEVVGYSDNKDVIESFIDTYDLKHYHIEKIKKIPEDIEYEYQYKEIFFEHFYDIHVTEALLDKVSSVCEEISTVFIGVEDSLRQALEYIKMEPEEQDIIMEVQQHLFMLIADLVGVDSCSGPNAFYSDYFDAKQLIKDFLHKNIVVYGGD